MRLREVPTRVPEELLRFDPDEWSPEPMAGEALAWPDGSPVSPDTWRERRWRDARFRYHRAHGWPGGSIECLKDGMEVLREARRRRR